MEQKGSSPYKMSKAFITFDGLFSILPALMIIMLAFNAAHTLTDEAVERMNRQQVFDKLVSIADYSVKQGLVVSENMGAIAGEKVRYPNWVDKSKITGQYTEDLRERANLDGLSIDPTSPGDGSYCIYRIVVVGTSKDIDLLYVCGD